METAYDFTMTPDQFAITQAENELKLRCIEMALRRIADYEKTLVLNIQDGVRTTTHITENYQSLKKAEIVELSKFFYRGIVGDYWEESSISNIDSWLKELDNWTRSEE